MYRSCPSIKESSIPPALPSLRIQSILIRKKSWSWRSRVWQCSRIYARGSGCCFSQIRSSDSLYPKDQSQRILELSKQVRSDSFRRCGTSLTGRCSDRSNHLLWFSGIGPSNSRDQPSVCTSSRIGFGDDSLVLFA